MTDETTGQLIRRLIGGDDEAARSIAALAPDSDDALLLAAAAVTNPAAPELLARAAELAASTQDRQLVAIVAAHLAGDRDLVDALIRDHLSDHPGSLLAAWIAATAETPETPEKPTPTGRTL